MTRSFVSMIASLPFLLPALGFGRAALAADAPATCLAGYRLAAYEYLRQGPRHEETIKTAEGIVLGAGGVGALGAVFGKGRVSLVAIAALAASFGGFAYHDACARLTRLENSTMLLSVYENFRNTGGAVDVPEGQDLLLQTFGGPGEPSRCALFSDEPRPEAERQAALAEVPAEAKDAVLKEVARRMESGQLCDAGNSPKNLGDIVADLRDFERLHRAKQAKNVY